MTAHSHRTSGGSEPTCSACPPELWAGRQALCNQVEAHAAGADFRQAQGRRIRRAGADRTNHHRKAPGTVRRPGTHISHNMAVQP